MIKQSNVLSLSNLTPETVVGIEGVPFESKAQALPTVVVVGSDFADAFISDDDRYLDVANEIRLTPDTEQRLVVMDHFVVAGGLCYDSDGESSNPLTTCDGNGSLYHYGRRASNEQERTSFCRALGFDSNGNKDLVHEAVSNELAARVKQTIRKDRSLMTTLSNLLRGQGKKSSWDVVLKTVEDCIHQEGWEYAIDYVSNLFLDVNWWNNVTARWKEKLEPLAELLCESEADAAWERAIESGKLGNSLAVLVDIYEHGGIAYSVTGSGMQCRFDTSRGGAVWVPDDCAEENIRYNVLKHLNVGSVKWFGACGSKDDPLNARYSLDGGETWVGQFATWSQAMSAMVTASGKEIDPAELDSLLRAEAKKYCKGVLDEYNSWVNGEVYGVVVYVIDIETGKRIEDEDDECWGHIGMQYAEQTLEDAILAKVARLGSTIH